MTAWRLLWIVFNWIFSEFLNGISILSWQLKISIKVNLFFQLVQLSFFNWSCNSTFVLLLSLSSGKNGKCRGRDRGGRDYYSPSHSRSVSRSVSPREGKRYKSNHNSKSPRQNDQSPHGKRDLGSEKRSSSPMKNGKSSWSPSLRENDHHKHGKKNQISDRRSPSPRRCERSLSRPPSRSRSYRYLVQLVLLIK